ncbi:MAG: hypothetical protein NC121_12140 [Blautia sp.]|nr:hypothetical protein [Blautia sp.]
MRKAVEDKNTEKGQEKDCDLKDTEYISHMEKRNRSHAKKRGVTVIFVLILVVVAAVCGVWYYQEKKAERRIQEYSENYDAVISLMLQGADEAGACCSFIDQVWYNAIYERNNRDTDRYTRLDGYYVSDFNVALDNLFADVEFIARIDNIIDNQGKVGAIIRKLKDPPEEFVNSFQPVSKLYDVYLLLTDMAISPSGSLNTFSEDFNKLDAEFIRCCQMMTIDVEHYQKNREAERRKREYAENLRDVLQTMLSGAVDAENCCNLIVRVWNNAIWEKEDSETDLYTRSDGHFVKDFNDALYNLFSDSEFCEQINSILENQERVNSIVGLLADPPEEYKNAYDSLTKCYDAYRRFMNMAVNPTGSLNTFSEDFDDADNEFIRCYQAMDFYIQD